MASRQAQVNVPQGPESSLSGDWASPHGNPPLAKAKCQASPKWGILLSVAVMTLIPAFPPIHPRPSILHHGGHSFYRQSYCTFGSRPAVPGLPAPCRASPHSASGRPLMAARQAPASLLEAVLKKPRKVWLAQRPSRPDSPIPLSLHSGLLAVRDSGSTSQGSSPSRPSSPLRGTGLCRTAALKNTECYQGGRRAIAKQSSCQLSYALQV